jgi:hypothetical protein
MVKAILSQIEEQQLAATFLTLEARMRRKSLILPISSLSQTMPR